MKNFCLDGVIVNPPEDGVVRKAILLLHGYGGDGKDISMLSINWKRHLKNTIIICPNGHERCKINPSGYQWFDLSNDDENYILEQSLNAEIKINEFLSEIKNEYNLLNSDICISGFSQGCMMAINIGLTSKIPFNCIVGFSGKIINKKNLSERIRSKSKTLLIHGSLDNVVSPNHLLDAKDFFIREKIDIDTKIIDNCDHSIPLEASTSALNFIKQNLNN
ncbi:MAG: serine esterase [Candidatus Pelagibacter sp. TMED118]|nr:MAG: serine esterase [Candidatus Pelagibacter sp. TMED118]|tara:strand:- start:1577 stop:2236 length:660 start_codon:yes stop_codon:yes gene_type:complete